MIRSCFTEKAKEKKIMIMFRKAEMIQTVIPHYSAFQGTSQNYAFN